MRVLTSTLLLATLTGCPVAMEEQPDPYPLSKEYYTWECSDYEDHTEVYVSTQTCDNTVQFIVAELHLTTGDTLKTNLKTAFEGDCLWDEEFLLIEEYCIQVEGVALTAYAN